MHSKYVFQFAVSHVSTAGAHRRTLALATKAGKGPTAASQVCRLSESCNSKRFHMVLQFVHKGARMAASAWIRMFVSARKAGWGSTAASQV